MSRSPWLLFLPTLLFGCGGVKSATTFLVINGASRKDASRRETTRGSRRDIPNNPAPTRRREPNRQQARAQPRPAQPQLLVRAQPARRLREPSRPPGLEPQHKAPGLRLQALAVRTRSRSALRHWRTWSPHKRGRQL